MDEEPRHLEERAALRELLDRIAAVAEDPLLPVDEGDGAAAGPGVRESRVVGDQPERRTQLRDVDRDLVFAAANLAALGLYRRSGGY